MRTGDGATQRLIEAVTGWQQPEAVPLVVAIDGHGAAGKSTIAEEVARALSATVVHTDDFFRESGAVAGEEDPPMAAYYDWMRLRREALEPLRARLRTSFRAFDWETDAFLERVVVLEPADLILLEGVSAAAPAVADLVDRTVLVVTPEAERLQRLRGRIGIEVWDEAWLETERSYFATRPPGAFDLIVSGSDPAAA